MPTPSELIRSAGESPHYAKGADWIEIADDVEHPADRKRRPGQVSRSGISGTLVRHRKSGVYMLATLGGSLRAVPHHWASEYSAGVGKGPDTIQEACIARMAELSLNPNQVAEQLDGLVSRSHVCDYLTRRSSIGSHKLQHLLAVLGMAIR